jgi:hypothetical protein
MDLHGARNCQKVVDFPHERRADNAGIGSDGTPGLIDTHRLSTQKIIREGTVPPADGLRPVLPMAHHSNVGVRNPRHTLGFERCMAFARPSY